MAWQCPVCSSEVGQGIDKCKGCGHAREVVDTPRKESPKSGKSGKGRPPCVRCGSQRMLRNVRIPGGQRTLDMEAYVYDNPDAVVFKGTSAMQLHAEVCANCGHVHVTVSNLNKARRLYLKLQESEAE